MNANAVANQAKQNMTLNNTVNASLNIGGAPGANNTTMFGGANQTMNAGALPPSYSPANIVNQSGT